jgi:hypothetical protein
VGQADQAELISRISSGLIAWSKRKEWRGLHAELLGRHSAQACAAAGVEMEDITDVLGVSERPPPAPSGLSQEQERALVHQGLEDHYRRVLDEPIPALGGKSPRASVKTLNGREKVAVWLKTLENHMARQDPDSPMGSYDVGWMWRELGVEALRR